MYNPNSKKDVAEQQLAAIIESCDDAILAKDLNGVITSWNPAAEKLYGYSAEEVVGKHVSIIIPEELLEDLDRILINIKHGIKVDHYETQRIKKNGEKIQVSVTISPIKNSAGEVIGASAITRDITERLYIEERIRSQYYTDSLTNLPNRSAFQEKISEKVGAGHGFALLLIDLDRFKLINESLGHLVGDQLLKQVGQRIEASCEGCVFARFGGDEFAILKDQTLSQDEITQLADKILTDFIPSFYFDSHEVFITPSIGVSVYPQDSKDPYELIQCAEIALYYAKEQGRNNFQFYNDQMSILAGYNVDLESSLRHAIEKGEMVMHYQPQVDIKSGQIIETEALVRWQDDQMLLTMPDKFIPIAEVTGLIEPLGELVLREACRQNQIWNSKGFPHLVVAVNISSRQFRHKKFINRVREILEDTGLHPKNLELEITERTLMESSNLVLDNMKEMASWGIKFALDDFSMGYSSLNYIHKFPLSVLKIDRSFTKDIPHDKINCAIAKSIIMLGHNLGMIVVAEAVETLEQLKFFYDNDCDKVQGFLFNSAVPGHSISEILTEGRYGKIISKVRSATLPLEFTNH